MWLAVAVTMITGADYVLRALRLRRDVGSDYAGGQTSELGEQVP
jgi:hypothetical protein